jgi:3-hydroxybutyryl-CoA dehydrogenase
VEGIESVAVLGGGTMGGGIAGFLARAGLRVTLSDASPELTEQALAQLRRRTEAHVEAGLLPEDALRAEVAPAEGADGADLVIEAVPEDPELKAEVLARASRATGGVIATNTSSLPIAGLAESVERPERFLGVHWFNPPEWTPGIEVIRGPASDAVVTRVVELLRSVGKQPAEVADRAGFVSNRLQMALLREALAIVAEGQTTREDLDTIVRSTFGFRLPFFGPFQIADMAGLDTYVGVYTTLERDVGPEFAPPRELVELVEAGRVGAKAGAGFEEYEEGARDALLLERDRRYAALARLLDEA